MRKRLSVIMTAGVVAVALTTGIASADRERERERAHEIPVVPVAIVLPVVGAMVMGGFYARARRHARRLGRHEQQGQR